MADGIHVHAVSSDGPRSIEPIPNCQEFSYPISDSPEKTSRMHPNQWEFQDPKLKVPTIYKAYIRPM